MARDQIPVRTLKDKEREEHEERLMERIRLENLNPLQVAGEKTWDFFAGLYNDYLYSSGVLLLLFSAWSVYPSFVRYRHGHLKRYRRNQLVFRRWFFGSVHMPKWDKKHLQRIVIPPPPQPQEQPDLYFSAAVAEARKRQESAFSQNFVETAPSTQDAVATQSESSANGVARQTLAEESHGHGEETSPFVKKVLSSKSSAKAAFHNAYEKESAKAIATALSDINDRVYSLSTRFSRAVDVEVDLADVKSRVEWAVHKGDACVVLREDHATLKSIPPGWEVWWASAEEQHRRNFCKFWILTLAFCRAMQDLLNMPDMPQLIQ